MWLVGRRLRRLQGWALLAGALVLGAGLGAVSKMWLSGSAAMAVGSVLAALFSVVSARGQALLDKRATQRDALPEQVVAVDGSGKLRRVRDLDDPLVLRVHPAAPVERVLAGRPVADHVPPYVTRDVDECLHAAVIRGGFVLLIGDSTAGKTRSAYEVVRTLIPNHMLIAPAGRESLATVVPTVLEQRRCVVWLDDLERFLGPGGLNANAVGRMLTGADREVLLLATMRTAEFDRYGAREESALVGNERDSWREAREVLELAFVVEMHRRWTPAELKRAHSHIYDPRIRTALGCTTQFGLAEVLAAGPELARDWRNAWRPGAHPRGAALVSAAVDCRRAGMHEPISRYLLGELTEHYLIERGGALLRPEPFEDALAWATTPSNGSSSLLLPSNQDRSYLAFDYLIDIPGLEGVPQSTWEVLVKNATPQQAFDIGEAAFQRFQYDAAVLAYRKAAAHYVLNADVALSCAIGEASDPMEAVKALTVILANLEKSEIPNELNTMRVRHQLSYYVACAGDLNRAVRMFCQLISDQKRILGPDHRDTLAARHRHAFYQAEAGENQRAVRLFTELLKDQQRFLGFDHPDTLATRHELAYSVGRNGDPQRAVELLTELLADRQRVLGTDSPHIFQTRHLIARFTGWAGNPTGAASIFRQLAFDWERTLGADHQHTLLVRYELIYFTSRAGDNEEARELFTKMLADRERALGPGCSGVTLADDLLNNVVFGWPPHARYPRKEFLDIPLTCQRVLGSDHPVTKEIQWLLDDRFPSNLG